MKPWHPELQAQRRQQVQALHRAYCLDLYDDRGEFTGPRTIDWRGHLWHALSFLGGEPVHVQRANAMLRRVLTLGGGDFWSSAAVMILRHFPERLEADVRAGMLERVSQILPDCARSRFTGYNDNFPAMAALTVLAGAELVNRPELAADGLADLDSLRALLARRGYVSEYTSPTYSALTLTCLAEIANLSPYPEARELARQAEARVWTEIASHVHPPTSSLAGPHSRAYMVDMCAHHHNFHLVGYQVFGEALFINPTTAMFPYVEGQALHGDGAPEFMRSHLGWQTTPTYHVPDEAGALALEKRYPYTVEASTEHGAFPRAWATNERHAATPTYEFQAGESHLHTYMTEDFAVGTSSRPFLDSHQHTAFHLVYRRRTPATGLPDLATLFPRFILNDRLPHRDHHMIDEGCTLAVAHGGTAMVLYHGKPAWTAAPPVRVEEATSLKLSLILTAFYGQPQELWLGDTPVEPWHGESTEPVPIFLHDGPLFLALHPLIGSDYGRRAAVRLEAANGFGMVNLINYEGAPWRVADIDLFTCRNGFVAEVARAADWPSFAAFRAAHRSPTVTDVYTPQTGMREVRYTREGLALGMMVSPVSEGIKYRTINGRLAEEPRFRATGFNPSSLPWW